MKETKHDIQSLSFEEAFGELEGLVQQLEEGKLSLDETIRLFERGSLLAQHCQHLLDKAELRVQQLAEGAGGETRFTDFEVEE